MTTQLTWYSWTPSGEVVQQGDAPARPRPPSGQQLKELQRERRARRVQILRNKRIGKAPPARKMQQQRPRAMRYIVSKWTRQWTQMVFVLNVLPFLSRNFPLAAFEECGFDRELFRDIGCVLFFNPNHSNDRRHHRVEPEFLQRSYAFHIVRAAFGEPIPEWWVPSDPNSFALSHQCEAYWRMILADFQVPQGYKLIPPYLRCCNPFHIRAESHTWNDARRDCTAVWPGGCDCYQSGQTVPPCLCPTQTEHEQMLQVLDDNVPLLLVRNK